MLRVILIGFILLSVNIIADNRLGAIVTNGEESTTIINSNSRGVKNDIKNHRRFKKDDHRYDRRYRKFDYDRYGYYNNDGLYFGYFDHNGYFFNNIYFEYNSQYNYRDRLYRRGYFEPYSHHYRRYRYYSDNDWNRVHRYREPNEIVRGYYYEERYRPRDRRGYIREEYIEDIGDDRDYIRGYSDYQRYRYRRDNYYNRGYSSYRDRESDRNFFHNSFFDDNRRDRGYRRGRVRDRGHIIYHRFSDKNSKGKNSNHHIKGDIKSSSSHGRLQITK